ncbi:MAG TPA: carbohydrate porin [Steroidobacteraceae bacterium]
MGHLERAQDQTGGNEAAQRLELKFGALAASDDFDHNRYAGSTRTQFMNWSLWDNTALERVRSAGCTFAVMTRSASRIWEKLSPDFQYVRNPGFNQAPGPVRFWGLRLHLEL